LEPRELPTGWRLWNEEPDGRVILAFRPDVFDADRFDPACLPTIYLSNGSRRRRPGAGAATTADWHVTLFLEPEIEAEETVHDDRETGVAAMLDLADRFVDGEIDYRSVYQVPRERYFEALDELVGG
jgi:hypothetical protein